MASYTPLQDPYPAYGMTPLSPTSPPHARGSVASLASHPSSSYFPPPIAADRKSIVSIASTTSLLPDPTGRGGSPVRRRRILGGFIANWKNLLVHVVPVCATAALLWMNHSRLWWYPNTGPDVAGLSHNSVSNLLQLVAKLHELVVIASLSAITLKMFRRRLIGDGLPLGMLSAAWRAGDLGYIASGSFFGNMSRRRHGNMVFSLGLFFILVAIILAVVGPASAVLLIPELSWRPLHDAFEELSMPIFGAAPSVIWPSELSRGTFVSELGDFSGCSGHKGILDARCSASGFPVIYNWMSSFTNNGLRETELDFYEPTVGLQRKLFLNSPDDEHKVTFATTLSVAPLLSAGAYVKYVEREHAGRISRLPRWRLTANSTQQLLQPLVQVQCKTYSESGLDSAGQATQLKMEAGAIRCFGDQRCEAMKSRMERQLVYSPETLTHGDNSSVYDWEILEADGLQSLIYHDRAYWAVLDNDAVRTIKAVGTWVTSCAVMAHWVPSGMKLEPTAANSAQSTFNMSSADSLRTTLDGLDRAVAISVDISWLPFLNPTTDENNSTAVGQLYGPLMFNDEFRGEMIQTFAPGSADTVEDLDADEARLAIQRFTAVHLANGMAHTAVGSGSMIRLSEERHSAELAMLENQHGLFDHTLQIEWDDADSDNVTLHRDGSTEAVEYGVTWNAFRHGQETFRLDFSADVFGYSNGNPSPTMSWAFSVMYGYFAILLAYAIGAAVTRATAVRPWDDVENIMALLWRSAPAPEIEASGVEPQSGVWGHKVAIRSDMQGRVSVVVDGADVGLSRLKRSHKYY